MVDFLVINFPLLCICIAMGVMCFFNYKNDKFISRNIINILVLVILLAVDVALETYAKTRTDLIVFATLMTFLGYVIRPVCLFFFIKLANKFKLLPDWVFYILFIINFFMYFPSLFINVEGMKHFAFYYEVVGTGLEFHRGYVNFTSHIISGLLLLYVLVLSFKLISLKHIDDAIIILICAAFVIVAVVFESISLATNLLNVTIAISTIFYFMFLSRDNNRRDVMTGLFNRKTYYSDIAKMDKKVIGIIQIDMNCLKKLNDEYGHQAGDKAITFIAQTIMECQRRDMYSYRMGGDEFLILSLTSKEEDFEHVISLIKEKIEANQYFCSFGFAYKKDNETFDELLKKSEELMYVDKANFYQTHNIERRK